MGKFIDIKVEKWRKKDIYLYGIPLSFILFFVLYILVRIEIQEHFIYGQVSEGTVEKVNYLSYTGTGLNGGWNIVFQIKNSSDMGLMKISERKEKLDKINFPRDVDFQRFKKGDKVTIKILNPNNIKLLTYNEIEVNQYNDYFTISFHWLFILTMLFLAFLPYYLLFKYKEKQRSLIIKILILNMLLAFTIAHFFTS